MMMKNPNDDMLDDIFAQAQAVDVPQNGDLLARIIADADGVQAGFETKAAVAPPRLWARMMDALGGWPAVSGLAAATVAGIWVGVAPPAAVEDLTASVMGDEVSVGFLSTDFGFDTGILIDG